MQRYNKRQSDQHILFHKYITILTLLGYKIKNEALNGKIIPFFRYIPNLT